MTSIKTGSASASTIQPRLTAAETGPARRAGWLLIAAFVAFVAAVAMMILLLQDFNAAVEDAAAAGGVEINDLSGEAIAPVYRESYGLWQALLLLGITIASLSLFAVAIRAATRVRPHRGPLATTAVVSALAMPFAWVGVFVVERGLASADPDSWVGAYDALYLPLIAAGTMAGSLAVIATALLLRRMGLARRAGVVVIALSALVIAVAPVTGAPPIVPLLLGAVIGIVLLRTARGAD